MAIFTNSLFCGQPLETSSFWLWNFWVYCFIWRTVLAILDRMQWSSTLPPIPIIDKRWRWELILGTQGVVWIVRTQFQIFNGSRLYCLVMRWPLGLIHPPGCGVEWCTVHSPPSSITIQSHASSTSSSLAVSHPSIVLAQCCLTSGKTIIRSCNEWSRDQHLCKNVTQAFKL